MYRKYIRIDKLKSVEERLLGEDKNKCHIYNKITL